MFEQMADGQIVIDPLVLGAVAMALLLVVIVIGLLLRSRASREDETALSVLEAHINTLTGQQVAMQAALHEQINNISLKMGQGLHESSEKTSKSLVALQERLKVIDKAQENITRLSTNMMGLQDILSNKQSRGAFGEIQLEDLVRNTMPPNAYEFQTALSNGRKPDCLIKLPNPPGPIVIDAKFPLESYHAIQRAENDEQKKLARRAFPAAILKHVRDISERYIIPGETAEIAMMFIPAEAVHAELHGNFEDTVRKAYAANVVIVSPNTLYATLNTMRAVLRDAQMREQAGLIQAEVGKLLLDIHRLDDRVEHLQRHFQQAEKDIHEIQTSSRKVARRADQIGEMEVEDGTPDLDLVTDGKS